MDYIVYQGKEYWTVQRTAKVLDCTVETLYVAKNFRRKGRRSKWDWLISREKTIDDQMYFAKKDVIAFEEILFKQKDFVYRLLNLIDDLTEHMQRQDIAQAIGISSAYMSSILSCSAVPSYEAALEYAKRLTILSKVLKRRKINDS